MPKRTLIIIVIIYAFDFVVNATEGPYEMLKNAGDVDEGRRQYNSVLSLSKVPRYGECWTKALKRLHVDCGALTDDTQSRLALQFANCFLDNSGHRIYPCEPPSKPVKSCTGHMDAIAFHAYTTFFTHTQNMCFFVKSQVWHEETENTISRLLDTSSVVQSRMFENLEMQKILLAVQKESLENDRRLLDRGEELNRAIETSKIGVKQMLLEFQDSTSEQHLFVTQMFDRVVKFHSAIVGEFAGVYSLVFFLTSMSVSYLLTTARRTANARFSLLCVMTANYCCEKLAIGWQIEENVLHDSVQDVIYYRVWIIRNISCWIGFGILVVFAFTYRDLHSANNELLHVITKQNKEIVSRLTTLSQSSSSNVFKEITSQPSTTSDSDVRSNTGSSSERYLDSSSSWSDKENLSPTLNQITKVKDILDSLSNGFKGTPVKRTPIRKRITANNSHESTPRESPYNLRRRTSTPRPQNPVINKEDPELFAATIHRLATISKENSVKVREALKAKRSVIRAQFSSDDD